MPPQLFRRRGRTASTNINENQDGDIDNLKTLMEEIRREHPDLTPSAVQRMAMERFSNKDKRCSQTNNNRLNEIMSGMTKFQFGLGNSDQRRNSRKSSVTQDETVASVPSVIDNNEIDPSDPEGRRQAMARRLNPRTSVPNIDTRQLSQSFLGGISSDDGSLEDSLQDIEASLSPSPRRQGSKRGMMRSSQRCSVRASLTRSSTELVDVIQEDTELHASIPDTLTQSHQDLNSTKSDSSKSYQSQNMANSKKSTCSEGLPEEIKEALGEFYPNDDGQRRDSSIRSARASRLKQSNCSSNSSIDSATFEGDFSAWARMSSTS